MTISHSTEGVASAFTPSDTQAGKPVARRGKKVFPSLPALPTGSRPTTAETLHLDPIEQLTDNAAANLYDTLRGLFAQLKATEAAAVRSLDALRGNTLDEADSEVNPEDVAADRLGDRLLHDAQKFLPPTTPYADYRRAEAFAAALFGDEAIRDFARGELTRMRRVGLGDGGDFTIAQEDELLNDAGYFAALVFRLAKLFFLTPEASAARTFFYAVGVVIATDGEEGADSPASVAAPVPVPVLESGSVRYYDLPHVREEMAEHPQPQGLGDPLSASWGTIYTEEQFLTSLRNGRVLPIDTDTEAFLLASLGSDALTVEAATVEQCTSRADRRAFYEEAYRFLSDPATWDALNTAPRDIARFAAEHGLAGPRDKKGESGQEDKANR